MSKSIYCEAAKAALEDLSGIASDLEGAPMVVSPMLAHAIGRRMRELIEEVRAAPARSRKRPACLSADILARAFRATGGD